MHTRTALLVTAVMLCSAGVAHAQVPVQSKVSMNFTLHATESEGGVGDTRIQRIRFGTKDFLEVMRDILGDDDVDSVVIRRTTNPAEEEPPIPFLSDELVLLDGDGVEIDDQGTITQTALDLPGDLNPLFGETASAVKSEEGEVQSRTDVGLEGSTWTINGDEDDISLSMVSHDNVQSRRHFDEDTDQGLFYESRSAHIHGGMDIDVSTETALDRNGVITGAIKAAREEIVEE